MTQAEIFNAADTALYSLASSYPTSSSNAFLLTACHTNLLAVSEYAELIYTFAYPVSTTWNVLSRPTPSSFSRLVSKKDLFCEAIPLIPLPQGKVKHYLLCTSLCDKTFSKLRQKRDILLFQVHEE